jgi:hypothetical protein
VAGGEAGLAGRALFYEFQATGQPGSLMLETLCISQCEGIGQSELRMNAIAPIERGAVVKRPAAIIRLLALPSFEAHL